MTEMRKRWDMFMESVSMSLSNITGNKMRTFLTTLGIIIGVAAIIALMTVVQGATDTMTAQFDSMGLGTLRISVNGTAIKRGLTDSEVDMLRAVEAKIPCGRVGTPADIAPAVLLLCSEEGGYITGAEIRIDGGMALK